jgi:hypothetical protein
MYGCHLLFWRVPDDAVHARSVPAWIFRHSFHSKYLLSRRHLLCRFVRRSRDERPEGSQPAFASDDVSIRISPITEELSLAPSSCTRCSIGSPYGSLSLLGEQRAFHVLHSYHDGLGSACPPEVVLSAKGNGTLPVPGLIPFWFELISIFSSLIFTAFKSSSPVLAVPSTLAPDHLDAGSRPRSSQ